MRPITSKEPVAIYLETSGYAVIQVHMKDYERIQREPRTDLFDCDHTGKCCSRVSHRGKSIENSKLCNQDLDTPNYVTPGKSYG